MKNTPKIPLFSIITVVRNGENDISDTMNSVLSQNFPDFEYIIFDGMSSDTTWSKIVASSDRYPNKVIAIQEKDSGIYDGMNKALNYSTGKYVLFLNSGDLFLDTQFLEKASKLTAQNPAAIVSDLKRGCDYQSGLEIIQQKKLNPFFIRNLCHQTILYKNKNMNFDLRFSMVADFLQTWHHFYSEGIFLYMKEPVIFYKSGGISDQRATLVLLQIAKAIWTSPIFPMPTKLINSPLYILRAIRSYLCTFR